MIRVPAALARAGLKAEMLLQVHDELVFEAAEAEVEKTIAVVRETMETAAAPAVTLDVPLAVEHGAAGHWDEAHGRRPMILRQALLALLFRRPPASPRVQLGSVI